MKILHNVKFLIVLIFILGATLRFYSLGDIPGSLNWDEVSWGYNSYSIAETGRDEHGKVFPLSFEAFGDYKQPGYIYLSAIPIKIFDLTPFSTRFASALAGTLSVLIIYLLVRELFWQEKRRKQIGLIAAFILAISPWSIVFSRVAYEANVALFFVLLGVYIFLLSIRRKNNLLLFLSVFPLALSSFTYHSLKVFVPLFTFVLAIYAYKYSSFKKIIILIFLIIYAFANILWIADMRSTERGRSVLVISQKEEILKNSLSQLDYDNKNNILLKQFHNRRIIYAQNLLENYVRHFDLSYLLMKGDNPRHHAPGVGLIYIINFFFVVGGGYFAFRKNRRSFYLIIAWILLAPIASSLAIEAPNASRNLIMLPGLIFFASYGWYMSYVFAFIKKLKILKIILPILLILNFLYFTHQYFIHTNTDTLHYWQDGYKEAVLFASKNSDGQRVFVAESIEQGYSFYLFYNKIDPANYLLKGGSKGNRDGCFAIDNVYFGDCIDEFKDGDLYITDKEDLQNITNGDKYFVLKDEKVLKEGETYVYVISDKIIFKK